MFIMYNFFFYFLLVPARNKMYEGRAKVNYLSLDKSKRPKDYTFYGQMLEVLHMLLQLPKFKCIKLE